MNYLKFVRLAIKAAAKARHPQHKMAAIIIRRSNVISIGWNFGLIHAEEAAINRAWRSDLDGTSMIIVRVRGDGSLGLAKPCSCCLTKISEAKIKRAVFSNQIGDFETLDINSNWSEYALSAAICRSLTVQGEKPSAGSYEQIVR